MKITNLDIENFRNITKETINACEGVNIIYGDNAQGKTNIVEAIWLFTGDKSFRGVSDSNMVKIGAENKTKLQLNFSAHNQDKQAQIVLNPSKKVLLDFVPLKSRTGLSGEFYCVLFSPVHLGLIKNGPEERRKFLDQTICQLKPKFVLVQRDFARVIAQRNTLLKDIHKNPKLKETLDVWDYHLARLTSIIMKTRYTYLEKLKQYAIEFYNGISSNQEVLDLKYNSKLFEAGVTDFEIDIILQKIKLNRNEDIATGNSNLGAHRDDVEITIDNQTAKTYASQGQQRSIVLALKLAECEIIKQTSKEQPVVLLDDVMSELDRTRQDYLLNKLTNRQIFITCCEKNQFDSVNIGKSFEIKKGKISKESFYN